MRTERNKQALVQARERDNERKREKRNQLTVEQLEQVRSSEKQQIQNRRKNMSNCKREEVKEKDRNRKSYWFTQAKKKRNREILKEIKKIETLFRVRKLRSTLSEEDKSNFKKEAKAKMTAGRKNGFLKKYKQRKRRTGNDLQIWKDFFRTITLDLFITETPKLKSVHEKLNKMNNKVKEMENQKREDAHRFDRMPVWTSERAFKQKDEKRRDESVSKHSIKMRKFRKEIKKEIRGYQNLKSKSTLCDTSDSTDDDSDNQIEIY